MGRMRRRGRSPLLVLAAVTALAACGSGEAASPSEAPSTVGNVGRLPDELPGRATPPSPPTTSDEGFGPYVTTEDDDPDANPRAELTWRPGRAGELADGNRLLVLGDSILESTTTRYGGEMCDRLNPHGWAVEIDAENGRDARVGLDVLQDRLETGEDWDAAVVMLGNNYRDDPEELDEQLGEILDLLAPAPVLLLTVTEFESEQAVVNFVIRNVAAERENVQVLEWSERTRHDGSLTGPDGLHLSEDGKVALVAMIRLALGDAPPGGFGQCLDA
jgi:lysophospholipase L1-like esterase